MRSNNLFVDLSVLEVFKLGSVFAGWLVYTEVWFWGLSGCWLGLLVRVEVLIPVAVVEGSVERLVVRDAVLLAKFTLKVKAKLVLHDIVSSSELVLHSSEAKFIRLDVIHAPELAFHSLEAELVFLNRVSLSEFTLDVNVNI